MTRFLFTVIFLTSLGSAQAANPIRCYASQFLMSRDTDIENSEQFEIHPGESAMIEFGGNDFSVAYTSGAGGLGQPMDYSSAKMEATFVLPDGSEILQEKFFNVEDDKVGLILFTRKLSESVYDQYMFYCAELDPNQE